MYCRTVDFDFPIKAAAFESEIYSIFLPVQSFGLPVRSEPILNEQYIRYSFNKKRAGFTKRIYGISEGVTP